jgi:hypothetical protein
VLQQGVRAVDIADRDTEHRSTNRRIETPEGVDGDETSHPARQHGIKSSTTGERSAAVNFLVGYEVAQQGATPTRKPGDFFGVSGLYSALRLHKLEVAKAQQR